MPIRGLRRQSTSKLHAPTFPRLHILVNTTVTVHFFVMSSSDPSCYTVVFESSAEYPSAAELRSSLEKGSDDVKLDTLRKIIISTINGNPQASDTLRQFPVYMP
jgi:coatomer subunit beta